MVSKQMKEEGGKGRGQNEDGGRTLETAQAPKKPRRVLPGKTNKKRKRRGKKEQAPQKEGLCTR